MKRNFLLMLLMTLLPLAGWAEDVTVGGYTVTLDSKVVALPSTGNATAPAITSVKTGSSSNLLKAVDQTAYQISEGKLVAAQLGAVGNYFLKVTTTDAKTLFVPFIVGKQVATEIVFNQATYSQSLAGGFEKAYHENTTDQYAATYDVWDPENWNEPNPKAAPTTENGYEYSIEPLVKPDHDLFDSPFIGFVVPEGTEGTYDLGINANGKTGFMRGVEFSAAVGHNFTFWSFANETGGNFMFAEFYDNDNLAKYRFSKTVGDSKNNRTKIWKYNSDPNAEKVEATYVEEALEATKDMANGDLAKSINFFLVPTSNPFAIGVTLKYYETIYAGTATTNPEVTVTPEDADANATKTWYDSNGVELDLTANNPFAKVGTYTLVVSYRNATVDNGPVSYAVAQYVVKPQELTVGAGNLYIGYGDPDPTVPEYGTVWSQLAAGDNVEDIHISGLSVIRKTPKTGTDPEPVGTVIPYTILEDNPTTGNENYTLKVTPTDGNIIVTKKFLSEPEFTVTVNPTSFVYDATAKMPTVTVKRDEQTLVPGTDYTVTLAPVEEGEDPIDNVNANVDKDGNLIDGKRHIPIIITGIGNYTSTVKEDGEETEEPIEKEFDIAQRNINTATIATINDVIFKNADWEPTPAVTYSSLTLVAGADKDFTYTYSNNKYVAKSNAVNADNQSIAPTCTINAVAGGNWYGTKDAYFNINPFVFVMQPTPGQGKLYGTTAQENLTVEGVPADGYSAAELTGDENATVLSQTFLEGIATWTKPVERSPKDINEVGIYAITIKDAKLNGTEDNKEDPAHNFKMTVEGGEFEIFNEDVYYVSSKGVTREFESNNVTVPFDGFYVYRKTQTPVGYSNPPRTRDLYVLIPQADAAELYAEVAERVKANALVTEPDMTIIQLQATNSPYRINPVISGDGVYDYDLQVLPESVTYPDGGNNPKTVPVFTQDGEGTLTITPRTIKIVPDDKTSVFGETLADLTCKVYGKADDGTVTKELTGFSFVEGESTTANTIGFWQGLTSEALTYVPTAAMTEDKKFDIVVNNQNGITSGNPNYNITFENGTYTLTPSTKTIEIAVTWTQAFGSDEEPVATLTATMGTDEYTSENLPDPEDLDFEEKEGQPVGQSVGSVPVDVTGGPEIIDGYPVNYTGTFTTTSGEALTIIVANQFPVYPTAPKTDFAAPYVKVTGPATIADLAEEGLKIKFAKPELGYVTDGADLQVECGTGNDAVAFGTAAGYTLTDADKTGAWAWAKNFASVTIKSGKARPTAADEITLDIAAFNKPKADATYTMAQIEAIGEKNDELIRDYHGYAKGIKVKVVCSLQNFEFQGDTWYSMVLPFDATPRQIAGIFGGFAAVDVLNENTSAQKASDLIFKLTMQTVDANTPFIVKTDVNTQIGAGITFTLEEGDKILYPLDRDADGKLTGKAKVADNNYNEFVGTYTGVNGFETSTNYLLMSLKGSLSPATTTAYVRPLGAYFYLPGGKNAETRIFIEEPDGSVTAIGGVNADETNAEGIYNLSGQRVNKAQKGIFIKDGKKVLVK